MTAGDPDVMRAIDADPDEDRTILSRSSTPPTPVPGSMERPDDDPLGADPGLPVSEFPAAEPPVSELPASAPPASAASASAAPASAPPESVPVISTPKKAPGPRGHGTLAIGQLLGNTYEIEALLARGGMGEVYRARHLELGSLHAIKVILPELAQDEHIISLFQEEARKLRRLRADAIVAYEGLFRDENGARYLVMEFVDGPSLAQVVKQRRLTVAEVRALRDRCASGLAAAHDKGVYHRDISPDNIILVDEKTELAKIIDFGIAKSTNAGDKTVVGNDFAGKYSYVSPEQLGMFGGAVDARSDMYSLGLVLVAAARGKHLDMGNSPLSVIAARQAVPDLSDLPEELRPEIAPMLEPDPANRPENMRHLPGVVIEGSGPTIRPTARPAVTPAAVPEPKPGRSGWLVPVAVGVVVFAAIIGGGAWLYYPKLFPAAETSSVAKLPDSTQVASQTTTNPIRTTTPDVTPPTQTNPPTQIATITPPEPVRQTAAAVQAQLNGLLATYDCAGLKGTVDDGLHGTVTGFAKTTDLPQLKASLASLGTGVAISADGVTGMVWPHCAIAALVNSATRFGSAGPQLVLNKTSGTYHDGEKLMIDLTMPAESGRYLTVDFFDSSGLVQHIYPSGGSGAVKSGEHIGLGKDGSYQMSEPYGPNMILALSSPSPLFAKPRPLQEDARAYIEALKQQLAARNGEVESNYKLFDTVR